MSIPSELGHLAMPTNFLAKEKNQMAQASFEPGTFRSRIKTARSKASVRTVVQETKWGRAIFLGGHMGKIDLHTGKPSGRLATP